MAFLFVDEHREYLMREFATRKLRRPLYSQRAFARDLGLSPSSLTDYLKGRMRFSVNRVGQLGKSIRLTAEQRQHWNDLIEAKFAKSQDQKKVSLLRAQSRIQSQKQSLSPDEFSAVSEWFYMAFLELVDMNSEKYSDLKNSAKALGVPLRTLRIAVKRMLRLNLLKLEPQTGLLRVDPSTRVGDQGASEAICLFHKKILGLARDSLDLQRPDQRFHSATMLALPKSEAEKILLDLKNMALKYLEPWMVEVQDLPKDSLYCLSVQFFDLMKKENSK